ncbi:hypothetical protein KXQ82_02465 [Mucilaginibacter sp. HMF5004]|uniref:hypothetical protein n=1 Tax=Mucilaginibacter rivuli TaxID=2857527 RepID=UPI001C5D2A5D|nr:hypothetical protein [Mucilaginibacter rivuli]MBW4888555.1 hypothetical protein [Mucilaginibacter rivuli]
MKKLTLLFVLITACLNLSAQKRIGTSKALKYKGKLVEVVGHAYYVSSANKDDAVIKVGYNQASANFLVHLKFNSAETMAKLTDTKFGHFTGKVTVVKGKPEMVITDIKRVTFYAPRTGSIDSALIYK